MSWPLEKLGNVIEFIRGITFKPTDVVDIETENSVVVMRTKNVQVAGLDCEDLIAVPRSFIKREEQKLRSGDMLISSANSWELVGKTSYVYDLEYESTAGGFISIIRARCEHIDSKYLYYWLTSPLTQHKIRHCGRQTTNISNLDVKRFKELEIPLPPLSDQRHIVELLDRANAICHKRAQVMTLADDFLRSVFLDIFGDPVLNSKGWKSCPLKDVAAGTLQNGAYFPKEFYSDDGVEMVHMGDAFYDYVPRGKMKRVNASESEISKYLLTSDDILISRRSLNYDGAAKPSLIEPSDEKLIFESSLIRLTPDQSVVNKIFLFYYLSSEKVKEHKVRKFVTGATIKGISQSNLGKVEVLVPPYALQEKFSEIFYKVKELTSKSESRSAHELFLALSQRAFTNKL